MEVTQKQVMALIKEFTGQANMLVAPRSFVKFTKDHISALVLNQIIYWSERTQDPDGWFYKSGDDWMEELTLTRFQVKRAVNHLKQFGVETKLKKAHGAPTLHYRLNNELFYKSFFDFLDNGISTNLKMENRESEKSDIEETSNSLTKTTHEITPNTTPTPLPPRATNGYKPLVVDAEKQKLRETIRTLIPGPKNAVMSGATNSRLHEIVDNNPAEWVKDGFRITADAGKGLSYLASILDHWTRHGKDCRCVDPKADKPTPISIQSHQYQKPIPFEPPKREFREEDQRLSPSQQKAHDEKMAAYRREVAEQEKRRQARLAQTQTLQLQA